MNNVSGIQYFYVSRLAGALYDATENYDTSFYMAGTFFVAAGLISEIAHLMSTICSKAKSQKT